MSENTALKAKIAKAAGVDVKDVIGFNEETKTIVSAQGGKYQLDEEVKVIRHLSGPAPKSEEDEEK